MGHARWNPKAWRAYARRTGDQTREELFRSRGLQEHLDPRRIERRDAHDCELNPASTPIIVAVDVTGSMGMLAEVLVKRALRPLFEEVIARQPVTDPNVMAMAVGDAWCDAAPLQVTQFEADLRIAEQIQDLWIEGGGGGNSFESYNLPWYFAATRTDIDSWTQRGKKGYLFTVGDEPCPPVLLASHVKRVFGGRKPQGDMSSAEVLALASRTYEVFHVVVEEGSFYAHSPDEVMHSWREVLGQRVLRLSDHTRLSEVIVSAIAVCEGQDVDEVVASWKGQTAGVVANAVAELTGGDVR